MKVHKVTISIIDFDEVGAKGIKNMLENARYHNLAISPRVVEQEEREIGPWSDDHPLNHKATASEAFRQLFQPENPIRERILDLMARAEKHCGNPHLLYNGVKLLVEEAVRQNMVSMERAEPAIEEMAVTLDLLYAEGLSPDAPAT